MKSCQQQRYEDEAVILRLSWHDWPSGLLIPNLYLSGPNNRHVILEITARVWKRTWLAEFNSAFISSIFFHEILSGRERQSGMSWIAYLALSLSSLLTFMQGWLQGFDFLLHPIKFCSCNWPVKGRIIAAAFITSILLSLMTGMFGDKCPSFLTWVQGRIWPQSQKNERFWRLIYQYQE